jgi:hypothetical protein
MKSSSLQCQLEFRKKEKEAGSKEGAEQQSYRFGPEIPAQTEQSEWQH